MEPLNLLTVKESATQELIATGARLTVRIAGQAFFTGDQAFKKAAEVAACVAALVETGLAREDIRLLSVVTEVESGLLSKSSSATYHLEVHCPSLDLLGRVLAAISAQKNAKTAGVAWEYPDLPQTKQTVLQEAVRAARSSAQAIADALGIQLLGIHKLSYETRGLDTEVRMPQVSGYAMRAKQSNVALENLDLLHATHLTVTVTAEVIVGTFA